MILIILLFSIAWFQFDSLRFLKRQRDNLFELIRFHQRESGECKKALNIVIDNNKTVIAERDLARYDLHNAAMLIDVLRKRYPHAYQSAKDEILRNNKNLK